MHGCVCGICDTLVLPSSHVLLVNLAGRNAVRIYIYRYRLGPLIKIRLNISIVLSHSLCAVCYVVCAAAAAAV